MLITIQRQKLFTALIIQVTYVILTIQYSTHNTGFTIRGMK